MGRRYRGSFIRATAPTTSNTNAVAAGVWTLEQQMQAKQANQWPPALISVCQQYTTAGTYTFVVPAGTTSISAVAIGSGGNGGAGFNNYYPPGCYYCYCYNECVYDAGGTRRYGGSGGGGGGLAYNNNIGVTAGQTLTIVVGAGGAGCSPGASQVTLAGSPLVRATGGTSGYGCGASSGAAGGGVYGIAGFGGGIGRTSFNYFNSGCNREYPPGGGGGGAGGYYGGGGSGGTASTNTTGCGGSGTYGGGGGGGGGATSYGYFTIGGNGGGGGGVGLLGNICSLQSGGAAGSPANVSGGGGTGNTLSGGTSGSGSTPGLYGAGGGGGSQWYGGAGAGRSGAVRIVGPGNSRQFPNTNV